MTLQLTIRCASHFRLLRNFLKTQRCVPNATFTYTSSVDVLDMFTNNLLQKYRYNVKKQSADIPNVNIRFFVDNQAKILDITTMNDEELDNVLLQAILKSNDKIVEDIITQCLHLRRLVKDNTIKHLLRHYGDSGKPEFVVFLQKYCAKSIPTLYRRHGEFMHYLAKAQCLKGNSEKGLSILKHCYKRNDHLRSFYRIIFKELIQDSVQNRSEASLVIFKRYVMEFSTQWGDHYPMVCFWHFCWSSSWFSDQMLSNELLESSKALQDIIRERAVELSITVLKQDYNEDAVMRLLQTLLQYKMMTEYAKVLQVLFSYKLRNRDIRGCTEIVRNCEVLGVSLPSDQQGKYIKMLIDGKGPPKQTTATKKSKPFKLKF